MWRSAPAILWIKGTRNAAGSPWACRKEDGAAEAITPGAKTSIPYILVANVKNIQNIKRSLSGFAEDPGYALYFFHNKLATEWADPTYQSLQVDYYEEPEGQAGNSLSRRFFFGKEKNALIAWLNLYQNVLYLAALLGVTLFLRKDHQKLEALLPLVVFLAGFWFYLIWETRARYVTPFVISLIPVAAYGLCRLFEQISHIKKKAAVEKCKAY